MLTLLLLLISPLGGIAEGDSLSRLPALMIQKPMSSVSLRSIITSDHSAPSGPSSAILPQISNKRVGFVDIQVEIPSAIIDLRYATPRNFTGRPVDGYRAAKCLLTPEASEALKKVQDELKLRSKTLRIFDCYRPHKAVVNFIRWAHSPDLPEQKKQYYPRVDKKDLFRRGYISSHSNHSRGSTVDLTIDGLDMGTEFDFFDPLSKPSSAEISEQQKENRALLKSLMEKAGFRKMSTEWWHFTLHHEPFSDQYFDFDIL